MLDSTRLLYDLQRANELAQGFSGCLDPRAIALHVTEGLVELFDCAFARIWLVEPDRHFLKLVASSGMYTRTDGSFSRVPMGAFKVGKIAQNRVSFMSNNLAEESWVKDRDWAIAHRIRGFAGYPLAVDDRVIGVLAAFSHQAMVPEFLEVLQLLCTTITLGLESALKHEQEKQSWQLPTPRSPAFHQLSLSDQLVSILGSARLTLIGTERPLPTPVAYLLLKIGDRLPQMGCNYCRLIYSLEAVALEAMITVPDLTRPEQGDWIRSHLGDLCALIAGSGGNLQTQPAVNQKIIQLLLRIPYPIAGDRIYVGVRCRSPVLQIAFTQLAYLAGLVVCNPIDESVPLITDDSSYLQAGHPVLWIQQTQPPPVGIRAVLDQAIDPVHLRASVEAVLRGDWWGEKFEVNNPSPLSEREQEVMVLLAQGLRDRDIAGRMHISERTVKFHINNMLVKLNAHTRSQAVYRSVVNQWIPLCDSVL